MTLDEAIQHCEEKALCGDICGLEHKQLAEWLKELKGYRMDEETKEHWSEWFDWTMFGIYETIYDEVPCNNWDVVAIEFEHRDGSISKAYMCPYEEWTDDDYWKSYEL